MPWATVPADHCTTAWPGIGQNPYHRVLIYVVKFSGESVMAVRPRRRLERVWGFHGEMIIPNSPYEAAPDLPLRLNCDLLNLNVMRDNMHDWVRFTTAWLAFKRLAAIPTVSLLPQRRPRRRQCPVQFLPHVLEWTCKGQRLKTTAIEGDRSRRGQAELARVPARRTEIYSSATPPRLPPLPCSLHRASRYRLDQLVPNAQPCR